MSFQIWALFRAGGRGCTGKLASRAVRMVPDGPAQPPRVGADDLPPRGRFEPPAMWRNVTSKKPRKSTFSAHRQAAPPADRMGLVASPALLRVCRERPEPREPFERPASVTVLMGAPLATVGAITGEGGCYPVPDASGVPDDRSSRTVRPSSVRMYCGVEL